jgi:hypothetical protein
MEGGDETEEEIMEGGKGETYVAVKLAAARGEGEAAVASPSVG